MQARYGMSAPALLAAEGASSRAGCWRRTPCGSTTPTSGSRPSTTWRWRTARAPTGSWGRASPRCASSSDRGVRVGLGTDGPASNDDLHLWDELRLAALLARAIAADPDVVSSATALRLATRGGGEALGLPVGALEVGRPADLIRLRTDDARFTPSVNDAELLGHLVWAGAGYLVTDVWVGGAQVVEGGPVHHHRR